MNVSKKAVNVQGNALKDPQTAGELQLKTIWLLGSKIKNEGWFKTFAQYSIIIMGRC